MLVEAEFSDGDGERIGKGEWRHIKILRVEGGDAIRDLLGNSRSIALTQLSWLVFQCEVDQKRLGNIFTERI